MRIFPGSYWFKRFQKECYAISPHIRIVPIKMGFFRIYWKDAYVHECYSEMPWKGYDQETEDPRLESLSYYQEFEDEVKTVRTVKNFVEGYWDSIDKIRTRAYLLKNDAEFEKSARNAYKQHIVK